MAGPPECFVCRKHASDTDGVIFDDGVVHAGHALPVKGPDVYLGYLVVEPRRHVPSLGGLTDDEASRIGVLVNRLSRVLREVEGAEHVYSFVFGDGVPHLHVMLAPRYPGTPPEYRGVGAVRLREWDGAPRGGRDQMADVCARLAAALGPLDLG